MLTPAQFEQIVMSYVEPYFTGDINGSISRTDERITKGTESLTVGHLSSTDGDVQRSIVNITIYVKDISFRNEEAQKVDYKPNTPRFDELTAKMYECLKFNTGIFWDKGNLWMTGPSPLYRTSPEIGEHFRTIRVQLKVHNHESPVNN